MCFKTRLQHRQLIERVGIARTRRAVRQCVIGNQIICHMPQPTGNSIEHCLLLFKMRLLQNQCDG